MSILNSRDVARRLTEKRITPVPLKPRSKQPAIAGWQRLSWSDPTLLERFDDRSNVGILLGESSANLVDVDLDHPTAVRAAPLLLPPTGMIWGRPSNGGRSHYGYSVDTPPAKASTSYDGPGGEHLVELRSTGGQTLAWGEYPPGRLDHVEQVIGHPLGDPASVANTELDEAVRQVAAAALLGIAWPKGARHQATLALTGGLLGSGWPVERVSRFLRAVCAAADDQEIDDRLQAVETTYERYDRGEPVTGWTTLTQHIDAAVVDRVRQWLGCSTDSLRTTLSKRVPPLEPFERFPTEALPQPLREWVETTAHNNAVDASWAALPALVVCAAAIGATRRLAIRHDWTEHCVLWGAIVGKSGTAKTPLLKAAMRPYFKIQQEYKREYDKQREIFDAEYASWLEVKRTSRKTGSDPGPAPQLPTCRRLFAVDTTLEAQMALIEQNPRGMLLYADELRSWVSGFTRYRPHGNSDISSWLSCYDAGTVVVDRRSADRKSLFIDRAAVSVIGGVQPSTLAKIFTPEALASGFAARLLVSFPPDRVSPWADELPPLEVNRVYEELIRRLLALEFDRDLEGNPTPHDLRFDERASKRWAEFYNSWNQKLLDADDDMRSALSKLRGIAARLALLHHVIVHVDLGVTDIRPIGVASVEAGITLATWFAGQMQRVYATLNDSVEERQSRALLEWVRSRGGEATVRDVLKTFYRRYRRMEEARAALQEWVSAGLARWVTRPAGPTGGRPVEVCVLIDSDRTDTADTADTTTNPLSGEVQSVLSVVSADCVDRTTDSTSEGVPSASRVEMSVVTTDVELREVVAAIQDVESIALDIETTGLDPAKDRVRLVQLATSDRVHILDLDSLPKDSLAPLFECLHAKEVVGHNLQFDLTFLSKLGFEPGELFDSMVASQLLHAGERNPDGMRLSHTLADVLKRELGVSLDKAQQRSDWSGTLTSAQLRYAADDVRYLLRLAEHLRTQLRSAGLMEVALTEFRAIPTLAWSQPVTVDCDRWLELARKAEHESEKLVVEMDNLAPESNHLVPVRNWSSPGQVKDVFRSLGVELADTSDDTLAEVSHPLAAILRRYRAARKKATAYGHDWLKRYVRDGQVSPQWHQLGAESGRMSSSKPNLQQVPREREYRQCFTARPGHVVVKADYSQIELRLAAKIANETVMIEAYQKQEDLHSLTASRLLSKPAEEVSKADRQLAKAVNFGLLYGMGARSLARYALTTYGVKLSDSEARQYKLTFLRTYPSIAHWHSKVKAQLERIGSSGRYEGRTLLGRRRWIPSDRLTEALNFLVQGTAADGLKRALGLLWERRDECPGAVPLLFVHDEIVIEVPEADAASASEWLRSAMVDAMSPLLDPVPCEVEVTIGTTWAG